MKTEILQTYELIAENILADGKKVVFLGNDEYIKGMQVKNTNFHFATMYDEKLMQKNLLYQAPLLHMSGLGNDFRANVLYSEFLGLTEKVPYLEFKQIAFTTVDYPVEKVKKTYFSFDDAGEFGTFISNGKTADWNAQKYLRTYDTALAHILLTGGTYAEPEFLSLAAADKNAVLKLETKEGKQIEIKLVMASAPYFSLVTGFSASADYMEEKSKEGIGLNSLLLKFKQNTDLEKADFVTGGQSYALNFEKNSTGAYQFKMGSGLKMRSCNNEYIDVKLLKADEGVFYYNVLTQSGKKIKIPLFTWKRTWVEAKDNLPSAFFKPSKSIGE